MAGSHAGGHEPSTAGTWRRRLTWIAVVVLLLDAVLLAVLWSGTGRPLFLLGAVLSSALALGVLWLRRVADRRWREVDAARRAAKAELEALSQALRSRRP